MLKKAGFVRGEVEGPASCYCLDHEVMKDFQGDLEKLFAHLSASTRRPRKEKHHD